MTTLMRGLAMMTPEQAIAELDALHTGDREDDHVTADAILLAIVPADVAAAYERTRKRIGFWYA